jgi:hypothetical protein
VERQRSEQDESRMTDTSNRRGPPPGGVPAGAGLANDGTGRLAHQIDHQRIATRAFAIYQSRRGGAGSADDDWRQAEAEYVSDRAHELQVG